MRNHSKFLPAVALAVALLPVAAMARGVWLGAQNLPAPQALAGAPNAQPLSPLSLGRPYENRMPVEAQQADILSHNPVVGALGAGASANFGG